ncbi:DinB family protein [Paenibacillus sepulcri]
MWISSSTLVNHGTYHRGNITAILRQLGHPGTPTDYVTTSTP